MAQIMIQENGVISLGGIDGWTELEPRPGFTFNINPPPADGRCDCCGRSLDELEPFGKAGDPLVGDFSGALLVKKFRTTLPPDKKLDKIVYQFFGECSTENDYEKARQGLIEEYGQKEAEDLELYYSGISQVGSSWECRHCAVLDNYEYHEKREKRFSKQQG